ncbi:MAG: pyruvate dehydrogenase (acetyl-transferring) E1 component subunit alpha [Streptomycetaceae bacterium]|nr:MAG: pyruvate dehydrogenase (acetyl-transferring) E1 component subunit alpha [Streptomycetaceae bacterium]
MDGFDSVVQLLDSTGSPVIDSHYSSALDNSSLLALYRDMVLVRKLDEQATALQRQGELGLWAPLIGQEAAQIGSGRALAQRDYAFATYREHGVAWCRGIDPVDMLRFWRGTMHQAWDANLHRLYGYQVIIGAHALHATGYAMGAYLSGRSGTGNSETDQAVVAYFGDGAMSEGDVNESFVFAATYQAPIVFFCQNNQWAISEPTKRQSRIPLVQRAEGFGLRGIRVDGNDVIACHAVTAEALDRARSGGGPTLIEAVTYRMGAHTTSDDPTKYRDGSDDELWRSRDPIDRLRIYLRANEVLNDTFQSDLDAEATSLAERMRIGCRELPDPDPLSMFENVYCAPDARLDEQRSELKSILAKMGD